MLRMFKFKSFFLALCFVLIFGLTACEGDIVGTARPSGVDSEAPTTSVPQEKPSVSDESNVGSDIFVDEQGIPYPLKMYFSSGVGAWYTEIVIHADGSFEGNYHDTDMGDVGEENPNGTLYICDFKGRFSELEKINDYTYSLTLESIEVEDENAEDRIEDGMLVVHSYPHGLMNKDGSDYGKEFLLFVPNTEIEVLKNEYQTTEMENFLNWWPVRMSEEQNGTLSVYGLMNVHTGDGFFTWDTY